MPDFELPRLSGADLVSSFGNDQAALRRYRILVALLREGRPAGEVARTFGVSRESIRRLRGVFEREGLAGLQSRKRGGGHVMRGSPLANAIQHELSVEPGIAAAALWRRVQARLREQGVAAPRSTFYRLLAQFRDNDDEATRAPVQLLRDALGDLIEDPPLALGRGELAALLLPDQRDMLQRGWRLRDALHTAIARLRPTEAGPVLDDARWRHYLIIAGEYQAGEERTALQEALALSTSTYSRAKREALERLVALLPVTLGELPPAEPPEALIMPPQPASDIDHEAELEQYMARLRRGGLALIWGPAGVGKLSLAAALAARLQARGQKVIWHSCRPPDIETNAGLRLLLALAAGLALEGRDIRLALVGRQLPDWADPERWPALPFPSDAAARQVFLARMEETTARPVARAQGLAGALRERVAELIAALPSGQLDTLAPEQIAQLLALLRPVEQIADTLRAALETSAAVE